jgi:hypothetical protein
MNAMYEGCIAVVRCLKADNILAPEWMLEEAADFTWATLSISNWEIFTLKRGWTKDQYIERIQKALRKALVRAT